MPRCTWIGSQSPVTSLPSLFRSRPSCLTTGLAHGFGCWPQSSHLSQDRRQTARLLARGRALAISGRACSGANGFRLGGRSDQKRSDSPIARDCPFTSRSKLRITARVVSAERPSSRPPRRYRSLGRFPAERQIHSTAWMISAPSSTYQPPLTCLFTLMPIHDSRPTTTGPNWLLADQIPRLRRLPRTSAFITPPHPPAHCQMWLLLPTSNRHKYGRCARTIHRSDCLVVSAQRMRLFLLIFNPSFTVSHIDNHLAMSKHVSFPLSTSL